MNIKPTVGQHLFMVGGYRRNNPEKVQVTVSKVGRLYFTVQVEDWRSEYEFSIKDWRQKGDFSTYTLYPSEQDYLEKVEVEQLSSWLRQQFMGLGGVNYTLDQLHRVKMILDE